MSRQGTKKVEHPGLSTGEVDEIKQAFDLFDTTEQEKSTLRSSKLRCSL